MAISQLRISNIQALPAGTPVFSRVIRKAPGVTERVVVGTPVTPAIPVAAAPAKTVKTAPLRVDIADAKLIDPAIGARISTFPVPRIGIERSQVTVPIAPDNAITVDTVFEAPADPAVRYYWPRYEIGIEDNRLFRVRLLKDGPAWRLIVHLKKVAPDALLQQVPGALELPHQVSVVLRYSVLLNGQAGALVEKPFTEPSEEEGGLRVELPVTTLRDRDDIYRAMTEAALNATLIVRLKARVAVQVPPQPSAPFVAQRVAANNMLAATRIMMVKRPQPQAPAGPLYRETDRLIDVAQPFCYALNLHGYIFEGLGSVGSTGGGGLLRKPVLWNGVSHSYYQAGIGSNVFYYLPDTFKLGRRPEAPHQPIASVKFQSADGSLAAMRATFAYFATAVVNWERLLESTEKLRSFVDEEVLRTTGDVVLEPLLPAPDNVVVKLTYPGADLSGGPFELRPKATVDLRLGVTDALSLPVDPFMELYTALFVSETLSLAGAVSIRMGDQGEEIPFNLRFRDTAEPLVSWAVPEAGTDHFTLQITNQVESSLVFSGIKAFLSGTSNMVLARPLESPPAPVRLNPGENASFRFAAVPDLEVKDVDLVGTTTVLDSKEAQDRLFDLILDDSTPPVYMRPIVVKTFKAIFDPPAADPQRQIMAIVIDFENGLSAELNADQLQQTVDMPESVLEILSAPEGTVPATAYRYKMNVVRLNGQTRDAEWRTHDTGTLFPPVE